MNKTERVSTADLSCTPLDALGRFPGERERKQRILSNFFLNVAITDLINS